MARADVTDIDRGWKDIEKQLQILSKSSIKIGFQEGSTTKVDVKGERTKFGGLSMPSIAAQNEFGTNIIPARPFMSTSFDENRRAISKLVDSQIESIQNGSKTTNKALNFIGVGMVGLVQKKIRAIQTPPNSEFTIKAKGSSKPLIDFGQMIQSVTFKIEK